ncbi:MAG: peptidase M23 [Oscillatoriales cyanobacterium]|nr:MAG: peptidase M23 [Oscillatoriales cyanobacterium]
MAISPDRNGLNGLMARFWQRLGQQFLAPPVPWLSARGLRQLWGAIALGLALLLLGWPGVGGLLPARSQSLPDLRQQQEQLNQQRQDLRRQQQQLQQQQQQTRQQVDKLQRSLQQTEQTADRTQTQLGSALDQLAALERDLALAEQGYQHKRLAVVARLRFLQQQSKQWGLAVLLQSKSIEQFLDRQQRLQAVYGADRRQLRELDQAADRLSFQRSQWQERRRELANLSQDLSVEELQLRQKTQLEQARVAQIQRDRLQADEQQAQLDRDSANLARLIRQRITEQQQAEAVARLSRLAALRVPGVPGQPDSNEPKILKLPGGILATPVNAIVTSGFGWRVHPILGYGRQHNGLDFGASYGTTIRAAHAGTVVVAGSFGGYGNSVVLDRGDGLSTLYGHASEVYVRVGQTVQKGEAIAAVGSTGLSTGPHLHFEVRENGNPVDPLPYLS